MALGLGLGATRLPIMNSGALGSTDDFIMTVRTTGASESFTIPTTGGGYNYDVDWGDGNTSTGITGDTTGSELITNGTFNTDLSGWTIQSGSSNWSWDASGRALMDVAADDAALIQNVGNNTTVYRIEIDCELNGETLRVLNRAGGSVPLSEGSNVVYTTLLNGFLYLKPQSSSGNNIYVDNISVFESSKSNVYASAGDYEVKISGTFPRIYFNNAGDKAKVIEVKNLGKVGWTSFQNAFQGCSNMTSFTSGNCDTSLVTNMSLMFRDCSSLTSLNVSGFDTSLVTNMSSMFFGCSSLTSLDVSGFDTSLVTNMASMFQSCTSLTNYDPSGFNIEALDGTGDLDNFATGTTIPTANYDALLINWASQTIFSGMSPNFGSSKYTSGGAAEAARTSLINDDGMTITDGGPV